MSNVSTRTFSRCAVAFSMKRTRCSPVNTGCVLRTEAFTTATISSSNMAAARLITSTWPFVTGSYEPGHTAMRLSGTMDADDGVAVAALVGRGQVEVEHGPAIALGDRQTSGSQHGGQWLRQLAPEALRQPVGRIEEDEIVVAACPGCATQEHARVGPADIRLPAERLEVGPDGVHGGRRGAHERRLGGAARQRLDAQRAGACEQVEHARAGHVLAEDREQRLAHAV